MKRLVLVLMFLWAGCSSKDVTAVNVDILGKWQLTEFCVGPGDGSCPPQVATTSITQSLEFRKDGSFIERVPQPGQFQTPIVSSGQYRAEGEGNLYLKFDNPGIFIQENHWGYSLRADKLTILPSVCNEGCSYTYRRI